MLFAGAVGYGLVIVLQNAGIERTSVSHAALIVGAVPALVALVAAVAGRGLHGPARRAGFALALAGVGSSPAGGGGAATRGRRPARARLGDAVGHLRGRPAARCSRAATRSPSPRCRCSRAALAAVPNAALEGLPAGPARRHAGARAGRARATVGTLAPFALFAYGQSRVAPELAGAFLNLEPLVGTAAGALAFGDPFGPLQLGGALVILLGIGLGAIRPAMGGVSALAAGRRGAAVGG